MLSSAFRQKHDLAAHAAEEGMPLASHCCNRSGCQAAQAKGLVMTCRREPGQLLQPLELLDDKAASICRLHEVCTNKAWSLSAAAWLALSAGQVEARYPAGGSKTHASPRPSG